MDAQKVIEGFFATLILGLIPLAFVALLVGGLGSVGAGFVLSYGGAGPFLIAFFAGLAVVIVVILANFSKITKSHVVGCTACLGSIIFLVSYSINKAAREKRERQDDLSLIEDSIFPAVKLNKPVGKIKNLVISPESSIWLALLSNKNSFENIYTTSSNVNRRGLTGKIELGRVREYKIVDIEECKTMDWSYLYYSSKLQLLGVMDKCIKLGPLASAPMPLGAVALIRENTNWMTGWKTQLIASHVIGNRLEDKPISDWFVRCKQSAREANEVDLISSISGVPDNIENHIPIKASDRIEKFRSEKDRSNYIYAFQSIMYLIGRRNSGNDTVWCDPLVYDLTLKDYNDLRDYIDEFCGDPKIRSLRDPVRIDDRIDKIYEIERDACANFFQKELQEKLRIQSMRHQ
jgi:hypothetical protein